MVKKRQAEPIPEERFASARRPELGVEVLRLAELRARGLTARLQSIQRPTFELLLRVTAGHGTHTVDFVRHRLAPGDVVSIRSGQVQAFGMETGLAAQLVIFQPEFVTRRSHTPALQTASATINSLFDALAREFAAPHINRALLVALLEALLTALTVGAEIPASPSLYARFCAQLDKLFTRAHEVGAYAALLNCSTRTLSRACEIAIGRSAKHVIDERIALEAKRLLAHGDASAAQIAVELGFAAATQFGKFFTRVVGTTPGEFRARVRDRRR